MGPQEVSETRIELGLLGEMEDFVLSHHSGVGPSPHVPRDTRRFSSTRTPYYLSRHH